MPDTSTLAFVGTGLTVTAALAGVIANLRLGRENTTIQLAAINRQAGADDDAADDRAYQRLERENERLVADNERERAAHDATRAELTAERAAHAETREQLRQCQSRTPRKRTERT